MTGRSLLMMLFSGLFLTSISQATPAPKPRLPEQAPTEARLEVKPLGGVTAKEQAATRERVLNEFWAAVQQWAFKPTRSMPGLKGTYTAEKGRQWLCDNIKISYIEGTGIVRVTCRAGTPQESADFANFVAKMCIESQEFRRRMYEEEIAISEKSAAKVNPACEIPAALRFRADCLERADSFRRSLATVPQVKVLKLACSPPEKRQMK